MTDDSRVIHVCLRDDIGSEASRALRGWRSAVHAATLLMDYAWVTLCGLPTVLNPRMA